MDISEFTMMNTAYTVEIMWNCTAKQAFSLKFRNNLEPGAARLWDLHFAYCCICLAI